jgi:DNA-binding transcriptional MerR regulator
MIYFISFLAVAAIPLAIGGYGAHLAARILESPERRKALSVIWLLAGTGVLLSGVQQILTHRSDREQELMRVELQEKAEKDQQQLREKLDSSLRRQDDVQHELQSILEYLRSPPTGMDSRRLAEATSQMVENAMHRKL